MLAIFYQHGMFGIVKENHLSLNLLTIVKIPRLIFVLLATTQSQLDCRSNLIDVGFLLLNKPLAVDPFYLLGNSKNRAGFFGSNMTSLGIQM